MREQSIPGNVPLEIQQAESPDEKIEDPKDAEIRKLRNSNRRTLVLSSALISSLATVGILLSVSRPQKQETVESGFVYHPSGSDSLDLLNQYFRYPQDKPPEKEEFKDFLFAQYELGRAGLEGFAEFQLKTDKSEEIKRIVAKKRTELAFLGAEILNLESDQAYKVDRIKGEITADGRAFDVGRDRDLFIVDEIINSNLKAIDKDKPGMERLRAKESVDDLLWLKDSNINLRFDSRNIGYPYEGSLALLARFYRKLDSMGVDNFAKEITFVDSIKDDALGFTGGLYFPDEEKILISGSGGQVAAAHEEAHHQSDINEVFGQANFDKVVADARQKFDITRDNRDAYISPWVIDIPNINPDKEDYAETIAQYYYDGVAFRSRIQELKYKNDRAAEVLEAKYNFAKKFFNGESYTLGGEPFNVQAGDVYTIVDTDPAGIPISLRETPIGDADSFPMVRNGNQVKIVEGPVKALYRGREVNMWNVVPVLSIANYDQNFDVAGGWVSEEWLGYKYWQSEAGQFVSGKVD